MSGYTRISGTTRGIDHNGINRFQNLGILNLVLGCTQLCVRSRSREIIEKNKSSKFTQKHQENKFSLRSPPRVGLTVLARERRSACSASVCSTQRAVVATASPDTNASSRTRAANRGRGSQRRRCAKADLSQPAIRESSGTRCAGSPPN
jgi:hypothetical protein